MNRISIFCLGLICLLGSFSLQAQPLDLYAAQDSAGPGDTISLPVQVDQFTDMLGLQFTMTWDTSVLGYVGTGNYDPALFLSGANFGSTNATNGILTFSWNDNVLAGVSIAGGSTIFAVDFEVKGDIGDSSSVCFTDNPTLKEAVKLIGGTFTLVGLNDSCGSVKVIDPCASFALSASTTADLCGQGNGSLIATATGGETPYQYTLIGVGTQSSGSFANLSAGTYQLIAVDNIGCADTLSRVVADVPAPTLAVDSVSDDACGQLIGSIGVSATGGTPGYQYSLDGGPAQSSGVFAALGGGSYTVIVTDGSGCTDTLDLTLADQPGPVLSLQDSSAEICGQADGSLTAQVSSGTAPFSYSLNAGTPQSSPVFGSLVQGSYTLTVIDANGCTDSYFTTVPEIAGPTLAHSILAPTCAQANGEISLSILAGGTAPFSYQLDQGVPQAAPVFGGLSAGTYDVLVVDGLGCEDSVIGLQLVDLPGPIIDVSASVDATCGEANGSATATLSGGNGPVSLSWNTVPAQTSLTASNLGAGTYVITATDSTGCVATDTATVLAVDPPSLSLVSSSIDSCEGQTGTAEVAGSLGTQPYQFEWNTTPVQTGATAAGLSAGSYEVLLTDANGCLDTLVVLIGGTAAPTVAWAGLEDRCADAAPTELSGGLPQGGTYGGPGVSGGLFDPAVAGVGQHVLFYSYTDSNGCVGMAMDTVEVFAAPAIPQITQAGNILSTDLAASYQWFLDGVAIPNSNSPDITSAGNGSYTVTITDANGCTATSEPFLVTRLAMPVRLGLRLYPNPHRGSFYLEVAQPLRVSLINALGQELYTWSLPQGGTHQLQVSGLSEGLYLLRLRSGNGQTETMPLRYQP